MTLAKQDAKQEAATPIHWHALPVETALSQVDARHEGLDAALVAQRRAEYGPNTLPHREPPSLLAIILRQFMNPLIAILVVAAVVSIALGELEDSIFIIVVVLLNAALGAYQEYRAEQSAAALQNLLTVQARVRRAGQVRRIDAEALVPGDIVLLESGDRVPADLRLLHAKNLTVDESFLTGESAAVTKDAAADVEPEAPVSERLTMAFTGATVAAGRGEGLVVATGLRTEIGAIAAATAEGTGLRPPLVIRMERFVRAISFIVLASCTLLIVIAMAQGTPFAEVFFLAVALAVSAIPEGLPIAMTVALSIAVRRMAQRNVIVRKMTAVEALGSCTIIASDKTGTLTVNRQTIRTIRLPGGRTFQVTGEGYAGVGEVQAAEGKPNERDEAQLRSLATAAILCNEAYLRPPKASAEPVEATAASSANTAVEWEHDGDAVDVAFLTLGYKLGLEPVPTRAAVEVIERIAFESERQYAAVLYREERAGRDLQVAVKGAAERVLEFCEQALTPEGAQPLDQAHVLAEADAMAEAGYRVLVLATGRLADDGQGFNEAAMPPLTLVGMIGMIDPLRPEAKVAVDTCRRAGVEVAMITGDHPATAFAIAQELGIAQSREDLVTGRDLPADADTSGAARFAEKTQRARVFARVTPLQKLRIVEALGAHGHFVAVTGDGVNDAPALRAANIGVAMGSGSDVAKDTAEIIVRDDNFASLVHGVEEGRYAYDNVRKVIYLLISTGAAEIALFLTAIALGMPLPMLAVQILWLNLVTNGIQGVALAFEGGEPGAMERKPRPPSEGIFNPLMIWQTLISGGVMFIGCMTLWIWLLGNGYAEAEARNLLLLLMVLFQNYHVFNARSEYVSAFRVPIQRNLFLVIGVVAALGIHLLAMYMLPFMQNVLEVAPVSLGEFGLMAGLALSILVVMEIFKLVWRRLAL
ncbi:MAG: HAD family hydrolase [Candidatus Viridilinea halotolerans]|uniref:HAD family hydrolase n=1 Tax=Candidatus Viridilinea halotolerans TaxID=2491704 RepID=A0A426TV65_9CHLR|nr:MAG: HAD family hydrolase [Candidatus Viridilinea halotolerans]